MSRAKYREASFRATVILTLAVCIGANTALFSIVNSVLLEPLPVPRAGAILLMANSYPKAGVGDSNMSSSGDYYDRLRGLTAFQQQAMFRRSAMTLHEQGASEQIMGMSATPSLFRLLQVAPALGRTFSDGEDEIGAEQKIILSYALWQKLYAGDPSVLGREIRLNDRPYTIVGVMPRDFLFVEPRARYWIPLAFTDAEKHGHNGDNWYNVGRLKPGATVAQAQAQVNALNSALLENSPFKKILEDVGFYTKVEPLKDLLVKNVRGSLYLLWGGAVFVLLIGAVNIANLALARAAARMREFATRVALGAGRLQIVRQLLAENVSVALCGGLGGLALGVLIVKTLGRIGLDTFPRAGEVHAGGAVVAFALGVAVLAGIFIAVAPLPGILRTNLATVLRESGRTGTAGRKSRQARRTLVVAQIACGFVLLAGAGLLLASFRQLLNTDPGFRTDHILTAAVSAPQSRYGDDAALQSLMNRSLEAIRQIPGVTATGATTTIPFSGDYNDSVIMAENYVMQPGESVTSPLRLIVTPGYMETMGMQLVRGRFFDQGDTEKSSLVVIVDERVARKFWPDQDPIGRRMFRGLHSDAQTRWIQVVGVVRSARLTDLAGGGNQAGAYYFPYAQSSGWRSYSFAARTSVDASAIAGPLRAAISAVDPGLALFDVRTMADWKELSLSSRRTSLWVAMAFGALALFLSAVGIYSVLSYLLGQRRREMGIRLAVGSSPAGIFRLCLREGLLLIGSGLLLGLMGSIALRKAIAAQIYGVHPLDPWVLGMAAALLGGVALTACLRPARQAMQVDPVAVLNEP